MERETVLSSYSVKSIPGNRPEDFVTKFSKPITLDSNYEHILGLNRIINMSFSWFNVNASYNNQTIAYNSIDNGSSFRNLVFSPGVWNYRDFDAYIKQITEKDDISLTFDSTTFRVTIKLPNQVQLQGCCLTIAWSLYLRTRVAKFLNE